MPSGRLGRIVQVTLGLSAVGVVVGGILGALVFGGLGMGTDLPRGTQLLFGAVFGAIAGAVLAPIAAWTLMRHVPIWRAIAETAVGTVVGAGAGLMLSRSFSSPWLTPVPIGVLGFVLAAVRLRLVRRKVAPGDTASV